MNKILASVALSALAMQMTFADYVSSTAAVVEEEPTVCESTFGGLFFGAGIGGSYLRNKGNVAEHKITKQKIDRFMGSVVLGGGKVFNDSFYAGVDIVADIMKSKKKDAKEGENVVGIVKNERFLPSAGVRFGFVKNDWMTYVRVSGSRTAVSFRSNDEKVGSCHKISPAFALGIEKKLSDKLLARVECEYKTHAKKTVKLGGNDVKTKNGGGFNLRAFAVFNVKI